MPLVDKLTPEEVRRNIRGDDRLYVRENHKGYNLLKTIADGEVGEDVEVQIDGKMFEGMRGRVIKTLDCVEPDG